MMTKDDIWRWQRQQALAQAARDFLQASAQANGAQADADANAEKDLGGGKSIAPDAKAFAADAEKKAIREAVTLAQPITVRRHSLRFKPKA